VLGSQPLGLGEQEWVGTCSTTSIGLNARVPAIGVGGTGVGGNLFIGNWSQPTSHWLVSINCSGVISAMSAALAVPSSGVVCGLKYFRETKYKAMKKIRKDAVVSCPHEVVPSRAERSC
jgi:uncharacterized membrane protein